MMKCLQHFKNKMSWHVAQNIIQARSAETRICEELWWNDVASRARHGYENSSLLHPIVSEDPYENKKTCMASRAQLKTETLKDDSSKIAKWNKH